ncbi:MAG: HDIG domain-containing protein [Muribaculaceae bacterium]|nr:HDIG domain-containing protein [Muribaculaceae bacterium]
MKQSVRNNIISMLLITFTVGSLSIFFGGGSEDTLVYNEGRPWNYPKLIAPFDIPIEYDSVSTKRIKDSIDSNFAPIFTVNEEVKTSSLSNINTSLSHISGITGSTKSKINKAVEQLYEAGIIDNTTKAMINDKHIKQVRVINGQGNESRNVDVTELKSAMEAYSYLDSVVLTGAAQGKEVSQLIYNNLTPSLKYDSVRSNALLEDAYKMSLAPHGMKLSGERIIDYGEIVTPQTYTLLQTYERLSAERNVNTQKMRFSVIGNIVVLFLLMFVLYLYIRIMHNSTYQSLRHMVFLLCFVMVFVLLVYLIAHLRAGLMYLIPFALVPIIITVFFNIPLAFFTHMVVVLICSFVAPDASDFIIMQFLAGIIAILSIKGLMQRSQLVVCAMLIFVCYTITYAAQYVARNGTLTGLDWHVILYFAVNSIVLSFAYFGIFIVEKIFGFTSQVTLVELSDINNPVLQELSENCPGTFQHSLQVATLAGEAARKVGANVQLVRAGALYHDIGKIDNPAFFSENQSGVNPHDVLQPKQSASIVISHVTDGIKRAEKAGLPQVLRDLIAQHHGRGKTRYFYNMALKQSATGNVDPEPFTYPGPNPQSKEAAILMMADSCEAATKSLVVPNEENITNLVNKIIDTQVDEGMFNESPISFKDISDVKASLIKRLLTFYHTRVSYPEDVKASEEIISTITEDNLIEDEQQD